ncbi:MAG: hypothetical protein ACP5HD_04430 [Thermoproteus sp.]
MTVFAEIHLGDLVVLWKDEDGRIVRVEYDKGFEDEALEEEVHDVVNSISETLARELKLPSAVVGKIKEALKEAGLPVVGRLRHEGYTSYLELRGKRKNLVLKIVYSLA